MKQVALDDIRPGQKLARSLYYQYGTVMLAAGTVLEPAHIRKLKEFGFISLYVYDQDTEDIFAQDLMNEKVRARAIQKIRGVYDSIRSETERLFTPNELRDISTRDIREKVDSPAIKKIFERGRVAEAFNQELEQLINGLLSDHDVCMSVGSIRTVDNMAYDHAIETTVLALLVGKRLGLDRTDLRHLAVGCLLHDIGYLFIPEDLAQKSGRRTLEEATVLRRHTTLGYYLLRDRPGINILSAHVAYQHHERQDGTGYPRCLRSDNQIPRREEAVVEGGGKIHRFASIAAVANTYDRLRITRAGRTGLPPDELITRMRQESGKGLNREATEAFLALMPVYPVGSKILVTDGELKGYRGVVVRVYPYELDRPVVRLLYRGSRKLRAGVDVDLRVKDLPIKSAGVTD